MDPLKEIPLIDRMIAPLRERTVLAEAVCEALYANIPIDSLPPKVQEAFRHWVQRKSS